MRRADVPPEVWKIHERLLDARRRVQNAQKAMLRVDLDSDHRAMLVDEVKDVQRALGQLQTRLEEPSC